MNNLGEESSSEDSSLAMAFANGHFLDESLYKKQTGKVESFINLCSHTPTENISDQLVIDHVVRNALSVEFGKDVILNEDMIHTIVEALSVDLVLKDEVIKFAQRHDQPPKTDQTLIN